MRFGIREVIFLLVLLAVPVASFWFVFRPQNDEINQARKEISHKEQVLESLEKATAQTSDLALRNQEVAEQIERIEARLPSDKEVDVILEQVADIARSNSLTLKQVRSEKRVPATAYMEQPLSMAISGQFERFYAFLLDLEQLDRITRLPNMRIIRSKKEDGVIEVEMTLSIYFESGYTGGAS